MEKLDELVPQYALNKGEYDSYKAIVDEEKEQIKDLLLHVGEKKHTAGGYTVTRSVSIKETWDEDKLLEVAKKHKIPVIKTKQYVDMQALEDYLYDHELSPEGAVDLGKCRTQRPLLCACQRRSRKRRMMNDVRKSCRHVYFWRCMWSLGDYPYRYRGSYYV